MNHQRISKINLLWSRLTHTNSEQLLVKIETSENNKVASLILNRPPVNSLSLEMCTAISTAIKTMEQDHPHVQAIVISSFNPSIFCAGLDLTELYNPDRKRLDLFWQAFQQVFLDLYGSRLATIAAVEGHAPAAGCMLALACDYRVMSTPKEHYHDGSLDTSMTAREVKSGSATSTIGLNEAKFGIIAPPWMAQLLIRTIGFRSAEKALSLGTLFTPQEALRIGMVDEVVPKDQIIRTCHAVALEWANIPPKSRIASKLSVRNEHLDHLLKTRQDDVHFFSNYILNDRVQKSLGLYLESLKKKK